MWAILKHKINTNFFMFLYLHKLNSRRKSKPCEERCIALVVNPLIMQRGFNGTLWINKDNRFTRYWCKLVKIDIKKKNWIILKSFVLFIISTVTNYNKTLYLTTIVSIKVLPIRPNIISPIIKSFTTFYMIIK